ncbi:unnamed protein product [Blepharisma stoltei]|uniref:PHD-type domain-containing protein n=1 Tax=Blepharisma stoltei TaxID=1481888 RepID=A0AAU9JBL7_9CILI|nr:unnamed protein product [Blepharisma stoltei]
MDYFPQGQDLSYFPEFPLVQRFPLDWNFSELKMKKTRSADNNYVDSLLKYYNNELEEIQKQIHPIKQEVFKNAYERWEKENKADDEELMKRYALIEKENEKMNEGGEKNNDEDGGNSKCRLNVHIKCLERQKKKTLDDLYILCRTYEKWEKENKPSHKAIKRKRTQTQKANHWKTFTPIEDLSLEYRIRQHIHKVNITQDKPFILIFNLKGNTRKSKYSFSRPQYYNLLAPEVILEDRVAIENRSPEECLKRYQDLLFTKIKNDALLKGEKICIYQGKGLGLEEAKIRLKRAKYERKHALGKRKKQKEFELAQVSKETYCTCNKPYYYLLPRNPKWTDEEYETKIKENEMIECTHCQNWFHLGCAGYQGTVEEAQKDDAWICKDCSLKRTKLS